MAEYIDKSIRMSLCFDELRSFNDNGSFLGKHHFISRQSEREKIFQDLINNPEKYFEDRKNIELNISRYSSYLKNSRHSDLKKRQYEECLNRHKATLRLYKECFNDFVNGKRIPG